MEEEKAAALYDELTRKGEGAARFKQGLGFSSTSNQEAVPSRGSALPSCFSSSSFLSTFVKASSPSTTPELERKAKLESIQNKLKKDPHEPKNLTTSTRGISRDRERDSSHSSCRSSRSRDRQRHSRRRSRSPSRDRDRHSRRRCRSHSRDDYRRQRRGYRSRSRERERERGRRRRSSRSESPPQRKLSEKNSATKKVEKERNDDGRHSYADMIEGYDKMTPAEKVKAKIKLQLSETAKKDEIKGMGSGWERFDFDKDASLDEEEIEVVDDDASLVKHIGQSFRFTMVEARREEKMKAAHDKAMFGASSLPPAPETAEREEAENIKKETHESTSVTNLLSDQVLTMQQGSWRDCVRKLRPG